MGTDITTKLNEIVVAAKVTESKGEEIKRGFRPFFVQFIDVYADAADVGDDPRKARTTRLAMRKIRVAADKKRKELKADAMSEVKAIDAVGKYLRDHISASEDNMRDIEEAEARREAERKERLATERAAKIGDLSDPSFYDLGGMSEEAFVALFDGLVAAKEARERKAREEAERIERERKVREEEEAKRKADLAKAKAEAALLRAERKKAEEAAAKKEREAREKMARLRREAQEKEARLRREAREARERAERAEREAAAKEAAKRKAAEEAERERLAKAARAAAAPDKEKLLRFADVLNNLDVPKMDTEAGKIVEQKLNTSLVNFANWTRTAASKL